MRLSVTTVVVGPFEQNCRIVKDLESGDGVVIDPGDEPERILAAVRDSGARITHILATHAHLDHVGAAAEVRRALGAPFCLHSADLPILDQLPLHGEMFGIAGLEVPQVDLDLSGVSEIPLGKGRIRVLHTPGHTPGGCVFLVDGDGCFGDSLFRDSVGRTDLGGDARVYARTLKDVILGLPDETVVRCGHGPDTTIGRERRANPFLNGTYRLV